MEAEAAGPSAVPSKGREPGDCRGGLALAADQTAAVSWNHKPGDSSAQSQRWGFPDPPSGREDPFPPARPRSKQGALGRVLKASQANFTTRLLKTTIMEFKQKSEKNLTNPLFTSFMPEQTPITQ